MLLNLIGIFCRTGGQTKMEVNQLWKEMLSEVFHFIFIDAKLTPISLEVPLIMKGLTPKFMAEPKAACSLSGLHGSWVAVPVCNQFKAWVNNPCGVLTLFKNKTKQCRSILCGEQKCVCMCVYRKLASKLPWFKIWWKVNLPYFPLHMDLLSFFKK